MRQSALVVPCAESIHVLYRKCCPECIGGELSVVKSVGGRKITICGRYLHDCPEEYEILERKWNKVVIIFSLAARRRFRCKTGIEIPKSSLPWAGLRVRASSSPHSRILGLSYCLSTL